MARRVHSMQQTAELLGYKKASSLYKRRVDDRIVFTDGTELRLINLTGRWLVPDSEIARILGERTAVAS